MKRKLALAGALVLGLALGGIIGAAGKTHNVTRTKTIARTTTVKIVRTKSVAPAACRSAIDEARAFALEAGKAFDVAATFPPLIAQAAAAGAAQDAATVTLIAKRLQAGATTLSRLAPTFEADAAAFNKSARGCG